MARPALTIRTRIEAEDAASPNVAKAQGAFARFGEFLRTSFVFTLQDVSNLARAAFDRIFDAARLEGQTNALRIQLAQQEQSFDAFIAKLNEVARGTVSTADLIRSSSTALLLGIPADQIADLLEIARASAIAMGRETSDAFNDIAVGIGRASPMILDNLGLALKLGPAYEDAARSLGKTTEELTTAEQKTALLNAVLEAGKSRVEAYGKAQSDLAEAIARASAAQSDFNAGASRVVAAIGTSLAIIVNASAAGWVAFAEAIARARLQFNLWTGDLEDSQAALEQIEQLEQLRGRMAAMGEELAKLRDAQWAQIFEGGGAAAQRAAEQHARLALAAEDTRKREEELGTAVGTTTTQLDAQAVAAEALAVSLEEAERTALEEAIAQERLAFATARAGQAALVTSAAFDALARSQGRQAATEAALAGGGRLILGGTRVLLPGGGSRLTSEPGFNGGRFV